MWWNPERFAKGATVGAPPDMFNQQGQDWSQPPLNPIALEQTGFQVYRDMVHGMFANAGAVRIDHILGLFRLWWIPSGHKANAGAYVHYDSDVMLGILALEASRADGVVVGEDLGVVPECVASSCPPMACWAARWNGSSSSMASSALLPTGVNTRWLRSTRMICRRQPVTLS